MKKKQTIHNSFDTVFFLILFALLGFLIIHAFNEIGGLKTQVGVLQYEVYIKRPVPPEPTDKEEYWNSIPSSEKEEPPENLSELIPCSFNITKVIIQ